MIRLLYIVVFAKRIYHGLNLWVERLLVLVVIGTIHTLSFVLPTLDQTPMDECWAVSWGMCCGSEQQQDKNSLIILTEIHV